MRATFTVLILVLGGAALAQQQGSIEPARVDAAVKAAFPTLPPGWEQRLTPDETMRECSAHRNAPPRAIAEAIQQREKARIVYPSDNQLIGDWKKGEANAQSGYGQRFTDLAAQRPNGGNCYACHQMTKQEVSYGTLGPSLLNYGKLRNFGAADTRIVYDKVYNSHATFACSSMPRFGANAILTIEQIKDQVALLMSPESPVNKYEFEEKVMRKNRREIIGALAASGTVLASTNAAPATPVALDLATVKKDTDVACVYHCDFGDPQRFSQMLQNMLNHYSAYDFDPFKLKLVVVAHAAGIKFFLDDRTGTPWENDKIDPEIYQRMVGLTKYGAEVLLCQITYKRLKIDPARTRKDAFLKFVPSGVATVAELQGKGFAYLKVG